MMEPTSQGDEKQPFTWERFKAGAKKFCKKHDEVITCIITACVVDVFMIRRAVRQTEDRVMKDWWVGGVTYVAEDGDGRERVYVRHNNGVVHSFSQEAAPRD